MMNLMMRETIASGTARNAQLPGWPAAGKTGTSQDFRDAWFIGYTAHLVAGVWIGNDDSSPTKKATGGGLPVEIWSRVMKAGHQGVPVAGLPGLAGGAPIASALAPANVPMPPVPAAGQASGQIGAPAGGAAVRPQPIDSGIDGWFIDRLFGRR
jgi:penicillin-binding protein 1A